MVDSGGLGACMGADCLPAYPEAQSYRMSTTTEDFTYVNGSSDDVAWGADIWPADWTYQPEEDAYALSLGVDKYNYADFRNKHVFAGLNEAFDYVANSIPVSTDTYVEFQAQLTDMQNQDLGGEIGHSKTRATLGVVFMIGERVHYFEVQLKRGDSDTGDLYDNVTTTTNFDAEYHGSPPDGPWFDNADGSYDRLSYGATWEVIYVYGPEIEHIAGLAAEDNVPLLRSDKQSYTINITKLVRNIPWSDSPGTAAGDWDAIEIQGIYVGVEVWGGGKINILLDGLAVYTDSTPPDSPSDLCAVSAGNDRIDVSWADNSSDEELFKIERTTLDPWCFSQIGIVGADVESFQDTALEPGMTYYYRVRSFSAVKGHSAFSGTASATTDIPKQVVGTLANPAGNDIASGSTLRLQWLDSGLTDPEVVWTFTRVQTQTIPNANTTLLEISDVTADHAGTYVASALGDAKSPVLYQSPPLQILVDSESGLPASGLIGLLGLAGACGLAAVCRLRA